MAYTGVQEDADRLSAYAQREREMADEYERDAMRRDTAAQHQLQQGVYDAQAGLNQQAAMRGAAGSSRRASLYAGDQLAAAAQGQSAALRAAELQGAQDLALQQRMGRSDIEMARQQNQLGDLLAQQGYQSQRDTLQAQEDAQRKSFWTRYAGGIVGAVGAGGASASDRSLKEQIQEATPQQKRQAFRSLQLDADVDVAPSRPSPFAMGPGPGQTPRGDVAFGSHLEGQESAPGARLASSRTQYDTIQEARPAPMFEMQPDGSLSRIGGAQAQPQTADQLSAALARSDEGVMGELAANTPTYTYQYKPEVRGQPGAPPGTHTGPMAQDLEKSELGRTMVRDTPMGKMVDTNAAAMGSLGLAAESYRKTQQLEDELEAVKASRLSPEARQSVDRMTRRGM